MPANNAMTKVYVGRFQFSVPETMQRDGSGYYSMYRTYMRVQPIPSGGFQNMVDQKIKDLRAKGYPVKATPMTEPIAGMRSIWSQENPVFPNIMTLEAMAELKGQVFVAGREADAGKEPIAEKLVGDLFHSYEPGAISGFSLGEGAILLEPSGNEQTRLVFKHRTHSDIELRFQTRTVSEPDTKSYADLVEERQIAHKVKRLRKGSRVAAGLKGRELWLSAHFPSEQSGLRFSWVYSGVAYNAAQPCITLVASAELKHRAELEAVWKAVLGSLDSIPLAPPGTPVTGPVTETAAIAIARNAARGIEMPQGIAPQLRTTGDLWIVTFPMPLPPGTRGPDYYAQIQVDRRTGKVMKVLVPS